MPQPDLIVVGAGVIGLASAFELSRRGLTVRIYDAGQPGRGASFAAGGMLGVTSETRAGDPLHALAWSSHDAYPDWVASIEEASGRSVFMRMNSTLLVATDDAERAQLAAVDAPDASLAGTGIEAMSAKQLPDGVVDNRELVVALERAVTRAGVELVADTPVRRIVTDGNEATGVELGSGERVDAGAVLLAAGAWCASVEGAPCGAPISPVRGEMVALDGAQLDQVVRWIGRPIYLIPRRNQRVVIGATSQPGRFDTDVSAEGLALLLNGALRLAPALRRATVGEHWAGLRPDTPDHCPILGASERGPKNLIYATGHYRNGILLSPITAHVVGELVMSGSADRNLSAFSPDRFQSGTAEVRAS